MVSGIDRSVGRIRLRVLRVPKEQINTGHQATEVVEKTTVSVVLHMAVTVNTDSALFSIRALSTSAVGAIILRTKASEGTLRDTTGSCATGC